MSLFDIDIVDDCDNGMNVSVSCVPTLLAIRFVYKLPDIYVRSLQSIIVLTDVVSFLSY